MSKRKGREHVKLANLECVVGHGFTMDDIKASAIKSALEQHNGNRTAAARALKVSLRSLTSWVSRLKAQGTEVIDPPAKAAG